MLALAVSRPAATSVDALPGSRLGRKAAEQRLADRRRSPPKPNDTPLVWVAAAIGIGLIASPAVAPPIAIGLSALALLGWAMVWRVERDRLAGGFLLASLGLLASAWVGAGWRWFEVNDVGRYARLDAEPVALRGVVVGSPTVYPAKESSPFQAIPPSDRTVVEIDVTGIRNAEDWRVAAGRCELSLAGRSEGLRPGDRVRVFGQLRAPSPARNPGERDAARRDRARRRLAVVFAEAPACVTVEDPATERAIPRLVAGWRRGAAESLTRRLPESSAPLVRAMLLGEASALTDDTIDAFRRTGTLHVLVVSGLHVGLVAGVLPALASLGLLPRRLAWLGALLLVVGYVAIAGARPPAVRAGVVAVAACLAALAGRRPLSVNSLAGGAIGVFAVAPGAWLAIGTQLSFLAASSLLGVAAYASWRRHRVTPPLERLIESARSTPQRLRRRLAVWTVWVLLATVVVQAVTGPLIASEFHLVSPAATPLALVVAPLIALTVGAGLFTLAFDLVGLAPLAWLAGQASGGAAGWLGAAVEGMATLPAAGFWTAGPAPWWLASWIVGLGVLANRLAYRLPTRQLLLRGGLALAAAGFAPSLYRLAAESNELRCSFLAVGHGSSTLVELPGGGVILVDAGALGSPERVTDTVARTLWSRGVARLDAVVLTHPDVDHYNALPGLLERFPVDVVWTTNRMFPGFEDPTNRSGPAELKRLLTRHAVPVRTLQLGDRLPIGEVLLEVLHPDDLGVIGSDNANSLVLGVQFAGKRVLLPGDLESPGIDAVLAQEPYDCDVLLAPHHGSRLSNPPGFAAWCRPETVIISSGQERSEAVAAYLGSGAAVWATHDVGRVTARLSAEGVTVTGHEKPRSRSK